MKVKKTLSLILALVMVFTMIPAQLILSSANYSNYPTEGLGAATKFVTDVTLVKTGGYAGCIRVDFKASVDNSAVGNANSKITAIQNVLKVDATKLSPVSSESSDRGTPTLSELIANQGSEYSWKKSQAGDRFALTNPNINTWNLVEDEETGDEYYEKQKLNTDLSALSYNPTSEKLFVCMTGLSQNTTSGTLFNIPNPTTVLTTYLKLINGATLTDVPGAIALAEESDIRSTTNGCLDINVLTENQISSSAVAAAFVEDSTIQFAEDFYASAPTTYTIKFVNEDGTELQSGDVEEGQVPAYTGATPTKEATAQYTYTFAGWDKEIVAATGNATYTATFNETVNEYEVKFVNYDGTELQKGNVAYGTVPAYTGETPTKAATDDYTYTFAGWDKEITEVTGAVTYTATFTEHAIVPGETYTIKFVNENGTILKEYTDKNIGDVVTYDGDVPTKEATAQYTYTFAGWDPAAPDGVVTVNGNATYTATFNETVNEYEVKFVNYDGTELQKGNVAYGTVPAYNGETPTKPATAQYTYTFAGWDSGLVEVTGAATYTATFNETVNEYEVKFVNDDGTELQKGNVAYGTVPTYTGDTPTKAATAQYSYTFAGWDTEPVEVTGPATYTATFNETVNEYEVKFVNDDGTELQKGNVAYGTVPVYNGETPTKAATAQYSYTFAGWDSEPVAVTGAVTYTATFNETVNEYEVKFVNYDGTELQKGNVAYGTVPTYTGETPTKPSTNENYYTFAGWDTEPVAVTGAATYTATFTEHAITPDEYVIKFVNEDGTVLKEYAGKHNGDVVTYDGAVPTKEATAQYTYTFAGWDPAAPDGVVTVNGNATYTATFNETVNEYEVKFVNYDGTELQKGNVAYGTVPAYNGETPTKAATAQYSYTFAGWDKDIAEVTGAATYTATFNETVNEYEVKFVNYDGTELQKGNVAYGETPVYNSETPTKAATAQYSYTFAGWDKDIAEVTGAVTYTATFNETVNEYEVKFVNYDGTELQKGNVAYGTVPAYNGETPTKEGNAQYTYTFAGWDSELVAVTANVTYTATFNETVNEYEVKFVNYDGTELQKGNVAYGTVPAYNGETPTKDATAQYTYTFAGWDSELVAVTANATYTATFNETVNEYEVKFVNDDGTELQKGNVAYGTVPAYNGETPTKAATAQYSYTFAGWDSELVAVTGAATYTATFNETLNKYTITFKNGSQVLQESEVAYGQKPVYEGVEPTKDSDAQYDYTFAGWSVAEGQSGTDSIEVSYYPSDDLPAVTGATTYQAEFDSNLRAYEVKFVNDNGSELQKTNVEYGTVPVYEGAEPTKEATAEYTYTFDGWDTEPVAVTGPATYTATYKATKNQYDVTVVTKNTDGTEKTETTKYDYGTTPDLGTPATDFVVDSVKYTFTGWDKDVSPVTGNVTYTAQYSTEDVTNPVYTITFEDEDGTVLQTMDVEEGTVPVYTGAEPTKAATEQYTYTFAGWDKEVVAATSNTTYTATYNETPITKEYEINFRYAEKANQVDDGELVDHYQTVAEGSMPEEPKPDDFVDGNTTYTFTGWDKEVEPATGDTVYTAVYDVDTKFVPDLSEIEALVERYNQMVLTGLYNKKDLDAVKEMIDDIYDRIENGEFVSQDEVDAVAAELEYVEDSVRKIDKKDDDKKDDDKKDDKKDDRKPGGNNTGDNATLVVMSIILVSSIGIAVISLKKKRERI